MQLNLQGSLQNEDVTLGKKKKKQQQQNPFSFHTVSLNL